MKKIIAIILIVVLMFTPVYAADLSSMSLDELLQLRDEITQEINSRVAAPEEPSFINTGSYVVGKDIKEGAYVLSLDAEPEVPVQYMIQNTDPDSVLDSGNVTVREAVTIHLEEGQVLKITGTARISLPKKAWWMP